MEEKPVDLFNLIKECFIQTDGSYALNPFSKNTFVSERLIKKDLQITQYDTNCNFKTKFNTEQLINFEVDFIITNI